jgi:hypothetical protein
MKNWSGIKCFSVNDEYKSCPQGRLFSWLIGMVFVLCACGCSGRRTNRVVVHLNGAFNRHFVIERAGLNDERALILDSGVAKSNRDSLVFELPPSETTIYFIRMQGRMLQLPFFYDSSDIGVFYNYTTGEYHYLNSPAGDEWKRFQQEQADIARRERKLADSSTIDSQARADSLLRLRFRRNFNFADTVRNPGLFLLAYNLVDFGNDYSGLEAFMKRVGKRFPGHSGIRMLVNNTLDYVSIFRSPLQIGDACPHLRLPDSDDRMVDIGASPGKYLLIDFWSTWCDQCRPISDVKKRVRSLADTGRLAMFSIAVDAEKDTWQQLIRDLQYSWPQLIDVKMWSGPAARTFRFDSIPFNYLVGPDGRILAKGIPADSLVPVLTALKIIRKK